MHRHLLPSASSLAAILALIWIASLESGPKNGNPSPILAARSNAASLKPPSQIGIFRFGRGKILALVDPVVEFMVDHRLFPQLTGSRQSVALFACRGGEMSGHFETVEFHSSSSRPRRPGEAGHLRTGQHPRPVWRTGQSAAAAG